jgi:hypothetical protein
MSKIVSFVSISSHVKPVRLSEGSDIFAMREAPPSYSLPATSFLPLGNQPPPAYDEAVVVVDGVPQPRISSDQQFHLNLGFTMDEIPGDEAEGAFAGRASSVEDGRQQQVVRRPVMLNLVRRQQVTSVASQTDESLFEDHDVAEVHAKTTAGVLSEGDESHHM